MTMPFSRPGAIDLSALARPATPPRAAAGTPPAAGTFSTDVTEENLPDLVERSMGGPVVLVVYSASRMPASAQLADDLTALADEARGAFVVGRVDFDTQPRVATALQVESLPLVVLVLQGQPRPLLQEVVPLDELRTVMQQVVSALAAQGMGTAHQPFSATAQTAPPAEDGEEPVDHRYAAAEDALMNSDYEGAVDEYQRLLAEQPGDALAHEGLARVTMLARVMTADPDAARAAAAAAPDDVDAQILVADLDLSGGHVNDAFARLLDLIRRTSGPERDAARTHLLELFLVVGNTDPRVLRGRSDLANALF